jgi:hypothetical protein
MDEKLRHHIASLPNGNLSLAKDGKSDVYVVDTSIAVEAGKSLGKKCLRGTFVTKADIVAAAVNAGKLGLGRAGYTATSKKIELSAFGLA